MNNFVINHFAKFQKLSETIEQYLEEKQIILEGIMVYGSATVIQNPRDVDILIVVSTLLTPQKKRELRGELAVAIRKGKINLNKDIEIRIKTLQQFSKLNPFHFGLINNYLLLSDPNSIMKKILLNIKSLTSQWNTKRIQISKDSWVILPKGKAFLDKPIDYSETLTE